MAGKNSNGKRPDPLKVALDTGNSYRLQCAELRVALRDLLWVWDHRESSQWTATDVERIQEIRRIAE